MEEMEGEKRTRFEIVFVCVVEKIEKKKRNISSSFEICEEKYIRKGGLKVTERHANLSSHWPSNKKCVLKSMAARSKEVMHSTAADAATIAQKANVGKLIIGHYSARVEDHSLFLQEAKPIFDNTFLAEENLVFEL